MNRSLLITALAACSITPALLADDFACTPSGLSQLCYWTINDQANNNPPNTSTPETFTQLLGINNADKIVGYYGSGATGHPNQGINFYFGNQTYSITFNKENFPGSVQTQVVGINNLANATTVGFWANSAGANFGFADVNGSFISVVDPATTGAVNQLLGVNNSNIAAGFYTDSAGNNHAYLYNIAASTFTPIVLPAGFHAVSVTATDINNAGLVTGFYTDTSGITHGFLDNAGQFTSYEDPSGTGTMFLGLNNNNEVVGSFVGSDGVTNGFLFYPGNYPPAGTLPDTWLTVDDPFASSTPEFGVTGTTVNGINDQGYMVGFFSNGVNGVDGFLAVPEPSTLALIALPVLFLVFFSRRKLARAS